MPVRPAVFSVQGPFAVELGALGRALCYHGKDCVLAPGGRGVISPEFVRLCLVDPEAFQRETSCVKPTFELSSPCSSDAAAVLNEQGGAPCRKLLLTARPWESQL